MQREKHLVVFDAEVLAPFAGIRDHLLALVRATPELVFQLSDAIAEAPMRGQAIGRGVDFGAIWLGHAGALATRAGLPEQAAILYGFDYTMTGYCGTRRSKKPKFGGIIGDLKRQFDDSKFQTLFDR
jgi:hypothetical protein